MADRLVPEGTVRNLDGRDLVALSTHSFKWVRTPCNSCALIEYKRKAEETSASMCPFRPTCDGVVWVTQLDYVTTKIEGKP